MTGPSRTLRVRATADAEAMVRRVAADGRDHLVMVLGTGCCDSTAPFLYDRFYAGSDVTQVGHIADVPVLAHIWLANLYRDDTLTVDIDQGVVNDSFSLESDYDCRFTLKYREAEAPTPTGLADAEG